MLSGCEISFRAMAEKRDGVGADLSAVAAPALYFPADEDINIWMVAVIAVGCAFIIFVTVSLYLLCFEQECHAQKGSPEQKQKTRPAKN